MYFTVWAIILPAAFLGLIYLFWRLTDCSIETPEDE
jgi:hypothetical protein